jgi:hypothetical protein
VSAEKGGEEKEREKEKERWRTHGVVHREKKKLQSSNCYFSFYFVRVRYGCIGALGFE